MSSLMTGMVFELKLVDSAKIVLLAFADHANKHSGSTYPAIATVAKEAGQNPRTVQRYVWIFKRLAVLTTEGDDKGGKGHSTRYQIDIERAREVFGAYKKDDPPGANCKPRVEVEGEGAEQCKVIVLERGKGDKRVTLRYQVKHDNTVTLSANPKHDNPGAKHDNPGAKHDNSVTQTLKEPLKEPARARDPAVDGSGDAHERSETTSERPAPYNTLWRERGEAMRAAVGPAFWQIWCADLIPLDPVRDGKVHPGNRYHLAARSAFLAEALPAQAAFAALAEAFGQPLGVHYRAWAAEAWATEAAARQPRPPSARTSAAEVWLDSESEILAATGRWYRFHGPHLFPLEENGDHFTVGVRDQMVFDLLRAKPEWVEIGHLLGKPIQLRLVEPAEPTTEEALQQ